VTDDWVPTAVADLLALADYVAGELDRHPSRLHRALVLDATADLAAELRDDDVRAAKRSTTWA
jgi:hypothetical protein